MLCHIFLLPRGGVCKCILHVYMNYVYIWIMCGQHTGFSKWLTLNKPDCRTIMLFLDKVMLCILLKELMNVLYNKQGR